MKTLDEVIKANECCNHGEPDSRCEDCPYNGIGACALERETDALHYLREYRSDMKQWESDRKGYEDWIEQYKDARDKHQQAVIELKRNDPLTWDELKQMEGKPVWVEAESISVGICPYWKDWYIIKSFSNDEFMYCNDGFEWAKETQGRLWQAYRKERK